MKPKTTSLPFSLEQIAAAKAAAPFASRRAAAAIDWSKGVVTRGGGVAATLGAIKKAAV